jgi:RND family efflux transporter MFP subunit
MSKTRRAGLLALTAAVLFLAGVWFGRHAAAPASAGAPGRKILYYHDPMHPAYKSDKPGIAPDCGMQLEPVYADGGPAEAGGPAPPGAVKITPEKQQIVGVRTGLVERTSGTDAIRLLGRVAVDEDRVYRVESATDGWVRDILPNSTVGSMVRKDELLATYYTRDLLSAQNAYLFVLNSADNFKKTGKDTPEQMKVTNNQIRGAEDNLRSIGMSDVQLRQLSKIRTVMNDMELWAPAFGLVLARAVYRGQRFDRSTEMYRIANIDQIWILADVFENERGFIHPGASAQFRYQGKRYPAKVSNVAPQFDPASRTLKVRLEAENPALLFRPDMFVDVEMPVNLPPAITVPADAVLDTGLKKTVFVDRGGGYFEPRTVETGWRFRDRVAIMRGLQAGERIVVSGNFLIDSETRLRAAAPSPSGGGVKDPVCGMDVDPAKAAGQALNNGKTYYFCSAGCKEKFLREPAKYATGQAHD